jgi:hypothetical protein
VRLGWPLIELIAGSSLHPPRRHPQTQATPSKSGSCTKVSVTSEPCLNLLRIRVRGRDELPSWLNSISASCRNKRKHHDRFLRTWRLWSKVYWCVIRRVNTSLVIMLSLRLTSSLLPVVNSLRYVMPLPLNKHLFYNVTQPEDRSPRLSLHCPRRAHHRRSPRPNRHHEERHLHRPPLARIQPRLLLQHPLCPAPNWHQPLLRPQFPTTSWNVSKPATAYSAACVGYGATSSRTHSSRKTVSTSML